MSSYLANNRDVHRSPGIRPPVYHSRCKVRRHNSEDWHTNTGRDMIKMEQHMLSLDEQTQFYKKVTKTSCGLEQWFETSVIEKLWFTERSFILVGVFLCYQGLSHRCRGRSCRCERWRSAGGGRRSWQGIGRGTESHTPTPGDAYLKEKDTHDKKKHILLM